MKPTLVVLAAGVGSRYGGVKQVEGIGPSGETFFDYTVYDAVRAGFGKVVFVIRKAIETDFKRIVENRFDAKIEVEFAFQELDSIPSGYSMHPERSKPWGTGHAVLVAKDHVDGPFGVVNADDFYGASALKALADALSQSHDDTQFFLVGYELSKTLSEQGSVSRGVIKSDVNNELLGLTEREKIYKKEGRIVYEDEDGIHDIDADSLVSMNLMGFPQKFMTHLDSLFEQFISENGNELKKEFYLPFAVNSLINQGEAKVTVIPTSESWFGITYPDDKAIVQASMQQLVEKGQYPKKLWD